MDEILIPDVKEYDLNFDGFPRESNQLISLLQHCQNQFGYISQENVKQIAGFLNLSEAHIFGVASFYAQFRFRRPGEHQIRICLGTACHVQGGEQLSMELQNIIGIRPGEISKDHKYDFQEVACLGCCAQAPVVEIDGKVYGKITREKLRKVLAAYE
jgi:NADH-quinone oxidoreductase subunit E